MKTLYLDCKEGLEEEMILGALFELCQEKKIFLNTMNHLFTAGLLLRAKPYFLNGIEAARIQILSADLAPLDFSFTTSNPYATDYETIIQKISNLHISENIKVNATKIFDSIQKKCKEQSPERQLLMKKQYFTYQSLFFVLGTSLLFELIHPVRIIAQLPAQININEFQLEHHLSVYILKYFCHDFYTNPPIEVQTKGIGVHTRQEKDFFVYAYLGELNQTLMKKQSIEPDIIAPTSVLQKEVSHSGESIYYKDADTILEISCNLDDMTGEAIGYAFDLLLNEGALDVFYTPIYMKKNRPGVLLTCLCRPSEQDKFTTLFFLHTTTRGVRYKLYDRSILRSTSTSLETSYGTIHQKNSFNNEIKKSKLEFEDMKKAADANAIPLLELYDKIPKRPF